MQGAHPHVRQVCYVVALRCAPLNPPDKPCPLQLRAAAELGSQGERKQQCRRQVSQITCG